jgi:RNA polymerase sigma factor (TIGR02999 family)
MTDSTDSPATRLLQSAEPGDPASLDALVELVYDELKVMARRGLARERAGHTLQTTALVHEAWLKLVDSDKVGERGRAYFFAAASQAMRQVLVEHARRRKAAKRGRGAVHEDVDQIQIAVDEFAIELLDLDDAMQRLAQLNPRHARVVECRYFGGLSVEQTAAALGIATRTVKSDWALARAWLYGELRPHETRD